MNAEGKVKHILVLLIFTIGMVAIFTGVSRQTRMTQAGNPLDNHVYLPTMLNGNAPSCRFGVNVIQSFNKLQFNKLPVGWYIDYGAHINPTKPNGINYAPVIRLEQTGPDADDYTYSPNSTHILTTVANNPGVMWFISNEPDRRVYQDDIEPHVYAAAYHELYNLIKTADPTAQIYAGTIVQPSPIRLEYLDLILDAYEEQNGGQAMPVDGWSIHNFLLNEVSCDHDPNNCWGAEVPPGMDDPHGEILTVEDNINIDLFKERILDFRQWMFDRGYGDLPLSVSEYGVLIPDTYAGFDPASVNVFMNATFDYMLNTTDPVLGDPNDNRRLVQTFSWYSTGHPDDTFNGYLFSGTTFPWGLSSMGQNFANYADSLPAQVDLYPLTLISDAVVINTNSTVTLTATIANSGNEIIPTSGSVAFYNGNPSDNGEYLGLGNPVSIAGCGLNQQATFVWTDVPSDTYDIYVHVHSKRTDVDNSNNTKSFNVTIP